MLFFFVEKSKNCVQITATPRRSILHDVKSSQMLYTSKNEKIKKLHNQIKDPLELRLVYLISVARVPKESSGSHQWRT
jgi:hypothetical protein